MRRHKSRRWRRWMRVLTFGGLPLLLGIGTLVHARILSSRVLVGDVPEGMRHTDPQVQMFWLETFIGSAMVVGAILAIVMLWKGRRS